MIINLTPHIVTICDQDGNIKEQFPSEGIARCSQQTKQIGTVENIPITSTVFGEVEGLPDMKDGVFYIVSRLVLSACPTRNDLLVPNEVLRDSERQIIGCLSLSNN